MGPKKPLRRRNEIRDLPTKRAREAMEIMKGQEALDMATVDAGARNLITGLEQRMNDVVESNIEVASNQVDAARLMEDLNARLTKLEYLNARVAKLEAKPAFQTQAQEDADDA